MFPRLMARTTTSRKRIRQKEFSSSGVAGVQDGLAAPTKLHYSVGLYGLRLLHDPEFNQFASRLEDQPGEIVTTTMVVGFNKTRHEVIQRIRENDFHHL